METVQTGPYSLDMMGQQYITRKLQKYTLEELLAYKDDLEEMHSEVIVSIGINNYNWFLKEKKYFCTFGMFEKEEYIFRFNKILNELKNKGFYECKNLLEKINLEFERRKKSSTLESLNRYNQELDDFVKSNDYWWYLENKDRKEYFFENLERNIGNITKLNAIEKKLNALRNNIDNLNCYLMTYK